MTGLSVVVVSDSHAPRFWNGVPDTLLPHLERADLILHAGDVCTVDVLTELEQFAPVTAVMGNNDGPDVAAWGAPDTVELDLAGVRVAMIHDSGQKTGRAARMHRRFPDADLVVFGHSHIPLDDPSGQVHLFNPGSVADPRRQPHPSFGLLHFSDGAVGSRIVEFERPRSSRSR